MNKSKPTPLHEARELTANDVFVDNEIICLVKNGEPATGRVTAHYEDGAVEFHVQVYNGKRHGLYEEFFENGDLRYWCRYLHDKRDFYDERYDKYGRLIQSDCWKNGVLDGRCESYELGQISAIEEYKDGMRHGLWETYGPRKVTFFHGRYVEDQPEGWHVWRYANNNVESEYHFKAGVRTGRWRDFYGNRQLKRERTYSDGLRVGKDRTYYENGVMRLEASYDDGVLDGLLFEWHPNGILKRATPYSEGQIDGTEEFYDPRLMKLRQIQWRRDEAVSDLNYLFGTHP